MSINFYPFDKCSCNTITPGLSGISGYLKCQVCGYYVIDLEAINLNEVVKEIETAQQHGKRTTPPLPGYKERVALCREMTGKVGNKGYASL